MHLRTVQTSFLRVCAMLLSLPATLSAQQDMSIFLQNNLIQSITTGNPAGMSAGKVAVALPDLHLGVQNGSFHLGDMFVKTNQGEFFNLEKAISKMDENGNKHRSFFDVAGLALVVRAGERTQFSISQSFRSGFQMKYPASLAGMTWYGNAAYLDQTLDLSSVASVIAYNNIGLGVARRLNDKLTLGARLNILSGMACMQTVSGQLKMRTSGENYQLTVESDLQLQTVGMPDFTKEGIRDIRTEEIRSNAFSWTNPGLSLDLGITLKPVEAVELGLSVSGLGGIAWSGNALSQSSSGIRTFEGVTINPFDNQEGEFTGISLQDSVFGVLGLKTATAAFSAVLPVRALATARYSAGNNLSYGAVLQYISWNGVSGAGISAQVQRQAGRVFSLGAMAGFNTLSGFQAGASAVVKLGPVQLFLISDDIIPFFIPDAGGGLHFRGGINIVPGQKKAKTVTPESVG
jgi:hypothetical protein